MKIKGIDISTYQKNVDYAKVKADGVEFAILRIGYTGYGKGKKQAKDVEFETHYEGFKKVGVPLGGYFFARGTSAEEGRKEAEYVLSLIKGKSFEYPIFYDTEDTHYQAKATKAQNTAAVKAFCETIKAAGYKTGVYAGKYWLRDKLNDNELKQYDHWIAQYNTECTYTGEYTMWQHTSKGKVNGISGNVDMNWCYVDYIEKKEEAPTPVKKTVDQLAKEVLDGKWGNGDDRKKKLAAAGYDYSAVQKKVNELLEEKATPKKTVDQLAQEVLAGQWGTGEDRKKKLSAAGYDYSAVQKKVNELIEDSKKKAFKAGAKIYLKNVVIFGSSTATAGKMIKPGYYYIYDGVSFNGRYRITNAEKRVGKKPIWANVTGYVKL